MGQDKKDKDPDKSNQGGKWEHIDILIPRLLTEMVVIKIEPPVVCVLGESLCLSFHYFWECFRIVSTGGISFFNILSEKLSYWTSLNFISTKLSGINIVFVLFMFLILPSLFFYFQLQLNYVHFLSTFCCLHSFGTAISCLVVPV